MQKTRFNEVIQPLPPVQKNQLVIIDWDRTLSKDGKPHVYLYAFAILAFKHKHDVVFAVENPNFKKLQVVKQIHEAMLKTTLPDFRFEAKANLRALMQEGGREKAYVVFDNKPESVPDYMDTKHVEADRADGNTDHLFKHARILGFLESYSKAFAALVKLRPGSPSPQMK